MKRENKRRTRIGKVSSKAAEVWLASLEAAVRTVNKGLQDYVRLDMDAAVAAIRSVLRRTGATKFVTAEGDEPNLLAHTRTVPVVFAWHDGTEVTVRCRRAKFRRLSGGSPQTWPELRGFPGKDPVAKLTAWASASDGFTARPEVCAEGIKLFRKRIRQAPTPKDKDAEPLHLFIVADAIAQHERETDSKEAARAHHVGAVRFARALKQLQARGFVTSYYIAAGHTPIGGSWPAGFRHTFTDAGLATLRQEYALWADSTAAGDHPGVCLPSLALPEDEPEGSRTRRSR